MHINSTRDASKKKKKSDADVDADTNVYAWIQNAENQTCLLF